jgi:hypothetical protein
LRSPGIAPWSVIRLSGFWIEPCNGHCDLWCFPRWNRFWTMYMTLMFLWWHFFVNSEATIWSVSSMRSSKMMKCFSLGSKLSRSGKPCWNYIPSTVPYNFWYSP